MKKKKIRLKGHESFILREGWLSKGMEAVSKDPKVFSKNGGADELGVGTNMAKAIRYWMRVCGLTQERVGTGVFLTPFGEKIKEKDPYLEHMESIWMLHVNLVRMEELATVWYLYFQYIDGLEYTREAIYKQMMYQLEQRYGQEKITEKSLMDDVNVLLRMYAANGKQQEDPEDKSISPFSVLKLIKTSGNVYQKVTPDYSQLSEFIVFYAIYDELMEQKSVSVDDILKKPESAGNCLNMDRFLLMGKLDSLQELGFLSVNRTAGLNMVYPNRFITKQELIDICLKR